MRKTLAFILSICCCYIAQSQAPDSAFIQHTFHSEAFGEERKVTVHLPSRYLKNPDEPMMVTYVLDAQGPQYFSMLVGNLDYLTSRYRIIPTIVVGIHSPNRFAEFTPFAREGNQTEWEKNFESKMPKLHQHFEEEVFPLIEANYNTQAFRTLIGHSRGGSFVVQTLFDGHKDMFDAYLAISPGLQFDNYQSIELAEQALKAKESFNKFFFVSSGDVGETEVYFDAHVNKLDSVMQQYPHESLIYHRFFTKDKDHFTTVLPALNEGLVLLKNEYMVSMENVYQFAANKGQPISSQIDAFIQERMDKDAFLHMPPTSYFLNLANEFNEMEDFTKALDMYQWVEKRDAFVNWWDVFNMGKCYKHNGKDELAQQYLDRTLIMLEKHKEQYGENYEKIRADVKQQMAEAGR